MSVRPALYSAEQVAEMAAYNATLTPAGQKPSRRGRGGGSRSLTRGGGSGYNPGRPAPGANGSRSLNAAGPGMLDGHIGTCPPVSRSATSLPINSRNFRPPPTSNPWASTPFASNPSSTSTGRLLISSLAAKDTAPSTKTISQPQVESMAWAASTPAQGSAGVASSGATRFPGFSQPQNKGNHNASMGITFEAIAPASVHRTVIMEPTIPASVSASLLTNVTYSPPRVRQPIVSNWNGDRTGSPQIPAHLQQSNAGDTIRAIALLIDCPYEDLTADGLTLGGGLIEKKRREAESAAAAAAAQADQDTAMMETAISSFDMSSKTEVGTEVQLATPQGNLADSIWSGPTWNLPSKNPRTVSPSILPAVFIPGPISPIGNATSMTNSENVRPAPFATLKDSKWATKSSAGPSYLTAPTHSHQHGWSFTQTTYSSADCTNKSSSDNQTLNPGANPFSQNPSTATHNVRFDQPMSHFCPAASPSSTVANASSIGQPKNLASEPPTTIAPANGSWPAPQPRHPSTIRTWEHDRSHASNNQSTQLVIHPMRTSGLWDAAYAYSTADTPKTSPVAAPQPARPTAPSRPEQKLSDSRWARC